MLKVQNLYLEKQYVSTQSVLEKSFQCQITYQTACQKIYKNHLRNISLTYSESIFQTYSGIR